MTEDLTYSAFESRYRNKQYIGSGGFAKVYKVFDHAKNHYVALKVADVRPEWNKFTLKNEVELVNKLPYHRNIARYDACYRFHTGFTGEMDFAVLKFYEYGNLEQFLEKESLTIEDKRIIVQGVLNGISFLHRNNVIHRDMKAQNILMHREDGVWTPKITDFGLSREILGKATITNSAIGLSYFYAAPEQIQNKKIYKNVDLWATGVIIYRIIQGELPFQSKGKGDNRTSQSQLELSRKIINLELPKELEEMPEPYQSIIKKCLVLDPEERVQSAEELIDLLYAQPTSSPRPELLSKPIEPNTPPQEDMDLDKTEIMQREPATEVEIPIGNAFQETEATQVIDQSTEIIPPRPTNQPTPQSEHSGHQIPPPSTYNMPENDYELPNVNKTVIVGNTGNVKEEPEAITTFKPNSGDPSSKFNWTLLLLPLFLIVGALAWLFFPASKNTIQNEAKSTVVIDKKATSNGNRYGPMEEKINDHNKSTTKYHESLIADIQKLVFDKANVNNYRPSFLFALNQTYLGKKGRRKTIESLKRSAEVAIKNGEAPLLLEDIKKNEKLFNDIQKLSSGKYWKVIIDALEKN